MATFKKPATRPRLGVYGAGNAVGGGEAGSAADIRLYTAKEVQELTGIDTGTLSNWRYQNKGIPYVKLGGAVRYEHSAIAAYIAQSRIVPVEPADFGGSRYGGYSLAS